MSVADPRPTTRQLGPHEQICPDPSAHQHHENGASLQDKAADAALYHTHPEKATEVRGPNYPLGEDGKLSSAGAATSLKYARAHELPSFPVLGIDRHKSAGSAANLAHQNQKSFEHWKPDPSAHASKAALLAKDYKMAPMWQPSASEAGSKAAMTAHGGPAREWWQPSSSKAGSAAAAGAWDRKAGLGPKIYTGATENDKMNALLAATASLKGRKRAGSTPAPASYPDSVNAVANSQSAATAADANRIGSRAMEASRVTHLGQNVTPKMFTEKPPIAWDVQDKKHDDALKASAVSMAKQMYAVQKVQDDGSITLNPGQAAARTANRQSAANSVSPDIHQQALQYISLQDAAQKLAAERLAKIQSPDETAAFRDWYGYPQQKPRSRKSVRVPNRQRASSEGRSWDSDSSDDELEATRIRSRQSQFSNQVSQVDERKRDDDRKRLMAAAERKVHAQMTAMDQKVFDDTGKMTSAMMEEWDAKARARAVAASEARMNAPGNGKVSVGGGKYMDQAAIDAIALARVQPTLDQINATAEKQRARDEEIRLDNELQKRQTLEEKQRRADIKADEKRAKNEEREQQKAQKAEDKRLAREDKEAQKAKREEEKRMSKDEKRKSKEAGTLEQPAAETAVVTAVIVEAERPVTANTVSTIDTGEELEPTASATDVPITAHRTASRENPNPTPALESTRSRSIKDVAFNHPNDDTPTSPTKSRFKSVLNKLKPKSRTAKEQSTATTSSEDHSKLHKTPNGAAEASALSSHGSTRATTASHAGVSPPLSDEEANEEDDLYADPTEDSHPRGRKASRVSSLATDEFEEARDTVSDPTPVPAFTTRSGASVSPNRGSRFHEEV